MFQRCWGTLVGLSTVTVFSVIYSCENMRCRQFHPPGVRSSTIGVSWAFQRARPCSCLLATKLFSSSWSPSSNQISKTHLPGTPISLQVFSVLHLPANSSPGLINLQALLPPPELPCNMQETFCFLIKSHYLILSKTMITDFLLSFPIFQLKNNNCSPADSLFRSRTMLWPCYEISPAATGTIY